LKFIKATMVFGLGCGYATLADVNFLSSGGAGIDVKLANYQDDHRGSAWGACTLVDGNSNCWWEGYGGVAPQYTVHDPLTSRDPRFMDCVGPEPSPMEIRTLTVQGQTHPCQCTGGFYKGYPCQGSNAADNQCHWFIFEVEGSETVASVDVTANGCGYNSGLNYAEFTPCSSADVTTCTDEIIATVTRSDCSSAAAPAPVSAANAGAGGAVGAAGGAAAVGDPHLQNLHGERFDLMKEGQHVLINIPRGQGAERALLRVQADARRLGGHCADIYFQEVNVTGSWAEAKRAGGYHYSTAHSATETPGWIAFGKVELKVVHGLTGSGLRYLNVYVKHLGQAGSVVGGLLGEDDHEDVSMPPAACDKHLALVDDLQGGLTAPSVHSVAVASLA
jgi:hypothetical protein